MTEEKEWYTRLLPVTVEKIEPDHDASIGQYILESNRFHPFWNQWHVCLIHLRDINGVKPAKKINDDATHEIMVIAQNPDIKAKHDDADTFSFLQPIDVVVQFKAENDADALRLFEDLIGKIKKQELSPDSDYRKRWLMFIEMTGRLAWMEVC